MIGFSINRQVNQTYGFPKEQFGTKANFFENSGSLIPLDTFGCYYPQSGVNIDYQKALLNSFLFGTFSRC